MCRHTQCILLWSDHHHTPPCTHHTGVESYSSQPECVQKGQAAAEEYHNESLQGAQTCGAVDTTDTAVHNPMQVAEQKEIGVGSRDLANIEGGQDVPVQYRAPHKPHKGLAPRHYRFVKVEAGTFGTR